MSTFTVTAYNKVTSAFTRMLVTRESEQAAQHAAEAFLGYPWHALSADLEERAA